jgi:hypothetical protein
MFRKLLGVVAALALPAVLAGQTPPPANPAAGVARPHGVAMQVQGEVVGPAENVAGQNQQDGVNEADGDNNDGEFENGDNNDGEFENGDIEEAGLDEPDGLDNDVDVEDQVDQAGEDENGIEDDTPAPPSGTGQIGQIGRHRP